MIKILLDRRTFFIPFRYFKSFRLKENPKLKLNWYYSHLLVGHLNDHRPLLKEKKFIGFKN